MVDERTWQRRTMARTHIIIISFLIAGFAAAAAVISQSRSWAALLVAFLLAFVAGPGAGLVSDKAAALVAARRRERSSSRT